MAAVFCSILFISCSSTTAKITIPEEDVEYLTTVYGGDDFIEIVPGEYEVEKKKSALVTTIPLKIVKGKRHPNYVAEEFNLYVTGNDDKYIKTNDKEVEFWAVEKDAAYKKLCEASIGDVVPVTFKYSATDSKKINENFEADF